MTQISIIPRATEKAYAQSLATNTYVFNVPLTANKQQITEAIEAQFNVNVTNIKTLVQSGKAVRFSRGKNRYPGTTNRKDSKKAYVTIAEGQSIQVFDVPVEEEKK
jgi:large subunit ribosomal protein L23